MIKVIARKLKPYERQKLHHMKGARTNLVNYQHARVILLSQGGLQNSQIAEQCDYSATWIRKLIHRFNLGGVDAISWFPYYCGDKKPRKFFADVVEQIYEITLSPPMELIGMTVWSLSKLRDYLKAQAIVQSISLEWLRQILRRHRIQWLHTKTWKESKDPEFATKYRRLKRLYAKRPKGGRRISVDEFGPLNLLPRHGKHFAKSGHAERHRATYSRKGGVRNMFGAYDLERDTLTGTFTEKKNWGTFLSFLKELRRRYGSKETLHIILDNIAFHKKAEVQKYARAHRIKFYWTPTNASWLNRIECQFTALKKFALENTDYRSHEQLQSAIESYLSWRNRKRQISVTDWETYCWHTKKVA